MTSDAYPMTRVVITENMDLMQDVLTVIGSSSKIYQDAFMSIEFQSTALYNDSIAQGR